MELRLAASKELRGDAFAGESAFLLAKALASLACSRSFARLVDDARESVVTNCLLVSCWSCLYRHQIAGNPVRPSLAFPSLIRRIIHHSLTRARHFWTGSRRRRRRRRSGSSSSSRWRRTAIIVRLGQDVVQAGLDARHGLL